MAPEFEFWIRFPGKLSQFVVGFVCNILKIFRSVHVYGIEKIVYGKNLKDRDSLEPLVDCDMQENDLVDDDLQFSLDLVGN